MTYLILGVVSVLVVIVVADMYAALERDWESEIDEGSCRGHCKHSPKCPTPWDCGKGTK